MEEQENQISNFIARYCINMNSVSFETAEDAVLCLCHTDNSDLRREAQTWLTQLQKTPQIFDIVLKDLVRSQHSQVRFCGATILHSKLLNNWSEIPASQYEELRIRLFEAVLYFQDGLETNVIDRLCISLAVFLLRTVGRFWPNALADLISLFDQHSSTPGAGISREKSTWLLLRILSVIPEEFQTMRMLMDERSFIEKALKVNDEAVFAFLEIVLNESRIDILSQASRCLRSWLMLEFFPGNGEKFLDLLIRVVTLTCRNLEASECSSNAVEAVSFLVCLNKDAKKALFYLEKLLCLFEVLASCQEITDDDDLIQGLYETFVDISESHMNMLVDTLLTDQRDLILKLLNVMLRSSNAPGQYPIDENYSVDSFMFWFGLQATINETDHCRNEEIMNIVKPFYKQLIFILIEKSMEPKDWSDWSSDDQDDFNRYQDEDIDDTFRSCYAILEHEFLEIVSLHLEQALGGQGLLANRKWRRVDSCLGAFVAVSSVAVESEDPSILRCFLLVEQFPWAHVDVQTVRTALEFMGSYAAWLCNHNEFLNSVLSLIFLCFTNPELTTRATIALKNIARECKHVLSPFAEKMASQMMKILKREQQQVDYTNRGRIIFCLGTVISLLPRGAFMKYLREIAEPYIGKIDEILLSPAPPNNSGKVEKELSECVDIFIQLFSSLLTDTQPNGPVFSLFDALLPRFRTILFRYPRHICVYSICVAIKSAVSNLRDSCAKLLPMIVELIVSSYSSRANIPSLKLVKKVLKLFGEKLEYIALMSYMWRRICYLTLNMIRQASTDKNQSNYTLLYEQFNEFCAKVLKRNRKLFLEIDRNDLKQIFLFAIHTIRAQEVDTVKSSVSFLCTVIAVSRMEEPLFEIIQTHGQELVTHILMAIGISSPVHCLELISHVLIELSENYNEWLNQWLTQDLAEKDFPTARASRTAKTRFLKSIVLNKTNEELVLDEIKEFSSLCRGEVNEDYLGTNSSHP